MNKTRRYNNKEIGRKNIKSKGLWHVVIAKVIIITNYSLLITHLLSCSSFLDEHPKDQIPEEEAYTDADALYRNCVATLYNYIGGYSDGQGLQGTCRGVYDLQTFGSDEAMLPTRGTDWYDGGLWQAMYKHSWAAGHDLPKNAWIYLYKVIALCNRSLEQLDTHKSLLTESQHQTYQAEVKALRAIYYWYLLDLFGRVPLITSTDISINEAIQSERSELFRFVTDELQGVLPYIADANSTQSGDYYGRVTKSVIWFVLAKLMLNAEVYTDDNWTDSVLPDGSKQTYLIDGTRMNAWEAAIFFCTEIEDADYQLEAVYSNCFQVYNENSTENIWTIPMDKNLYSNQMQNLFRSYHYRHAAAYGFTGENGTCATKHTLEVYGYGTPEVDERFRDNFYAGTVYDLNQNVVADRTGQPLVYHPWEVDLDLSGSPYVETAGARMKKYEVDKNATKDGKLMDNDIVLFRYADVLLMKAEAKVRNGQDGSAELNAVRKRAGMPVREATLDNILDERLLELCWEGWRRQDQIRFRQYRSLYQGADSIDESDGHTTVFPIPADVMASNPYLTQNPGY